MIFIHSQHREDSVIEHRVFLFKNSSFEVSHNFKVSVYKGNETLAYFEPGDFNMSREESLRELSQKEKEDVYNDYLNYKKILKSKYIPFLLEKGVFVNSCHDNRDSFLGVKLLKVVSFVCFPIFYLYISRWH